MAQAKAEIKAIITGEDSSGSAALQKFSNNIDKTAAAANVAASSATRSFTNFAQNASNSFGSIADGISSLATKLAILGTGATFGAAKFVNLASDLQNTQQSLAVLIGSTEQANKVFGELYTYTLGKPIAFPTAALAAKTLAGYGIEAGKIVPAMKDLGNMSVATGGDLDRLSLAYGQVNARGKLMGQEVLQLVDNSVPIVKILATHFHKNITDMANDMQGGAVSAQDFNAAIHEYVQTLDISKFSNTFRNRLISLQGSLRSFGLGLLGVKVDPKLGLIVEPGGVFDRLSNALPKIAESLKKMKPAFVSGIGWIIDNGNTIKAIIAGIAAAFVVAKVAAIGFAIAANIANPFAWIVAGIALLIALQVRFDIFGKAIQAIQPILNIIGAIFIDLWKSVSSLAVVLGNELAPVFNFVAQHADAFKNILLVMIAVGFVPLAIMIATIMFALKAISIVIQFVASNFDTIKNVLLVVMAVALFPLLPLIGLIVLLVRNWGDIMGWLGAVTSTILGTVSSAWNAVYGAVSSIVGAIISLFSGAAGWLLEAGRNIIRGLINGISSLFNAARDAARSVVDNATSLFRNAGSWLYDAGKNLIQGLINGVKDMSGAAVSAAGNVASAVKDKVKGLLGIHSPSTVFAGYGENLVQGMVNGIEDNISGLRDAAGSMVMGVQNPSSSYGQSINPFSSGNSSQTTTTVQKQAPTINVTINAQAFAGSQIEARKFAQMIMGAYGDAQAAKGQM